MTTRPTHHVGNAGEEAFEHQIVVDGESLSFTIPPGTGLDDVPFSDEELAEHETRRTRVAAEEKEAVKTAAEERKLLDRLAAGKATAAETQAALARLLGHV